MWKSLNNQPCNIFHVYNPAIHHRRSIRLKGYDYSQAGMYFITICCQDMLCRFGKIDNGGIILNDFGAIAFEEWRKLPERYPNVVLDVFQIMPNHIHGIIALENISWAGLAPAQIEPTAAQFNPAPTIGNIVGAYKSLVANGCLRICKSRNEYMGKLWQRNYWEHIISNNIAYQRIADYIISNPANWEKDKFYVE